MKRVIVCADDFGLTVEVNKAVEAACRDGVLTCASLMVGEGAVADAVAVAKRLPRLGVGLHIVLVDGTPILPPAQIPDLVDSQGRFPTDQLSTGLRFFFKPGVRAQLAAEITAQFEAFKATGLALDHVNAHKHMHLHPTVAKLIIAIGKRYGMRAMRVPAEPPFPVVQAEPADYGFGAKAMYWWCRVLRGQISRAGLACNDHLFGLAWTGQLSEARLINLIPHLPPGISEIYSHPAASRDPTLTALMPGYCHEAEFAALISQKLHQLIAKSGIELITYAGSNGGAMIRTTSVLGLAGLGLAIALIIYEGFGSVLGDLYVGGIGLVWASLFHFIPMTINAYAWRALVVGPKRPSLLAFTWTVWVREAVNGLLPVARVGGEVVSVSLLMRRGLTGRFAVGTIIVDMTLSIVSQFIFTVMGLCMLLARTDDIATLERIALGLLLMVPVVLAFVAVQKIGLFELLRRLLKGLFGANWPALTDGSADLDDTIRLIYRDRMRLASCFFWQFVGWLVGAGEIYLALMFLDHPIDIEDSLMLEALAQAVSSAAFIVPGAVGVQEGGYVLFGALLGLGPDISLALALARRVRDLLIFVPALVVWQLSEGRRFFSSDWFRRFFRREKKAAPAVAPATQDDD